MANIMRIGGGGKKFLLKHEARQINYTTNFYVVIDLGGNHKVIDALARHGVEGNVGPQNTIEASLNNSTWVPLVRGNSYRYLRAKHQGQEKLGNFVSLAVMYE